MNTQIDNEKLPIVDIPARALTIDYGPEEWKDAYSKALEALSKYPESQIRNEQMEFLQKVLDNICIPSAVPDSSNTSVGE